MFLWGTKCWSAFINNICLVFIVYLECSCDRRGTDDTKCPAGSPCFCDQETGQCPCRTGVNGALCNECEDGYWNLDGESGCEPCNCDPEHALHYICDKVNTVSYVNITNELFTINFSSQGHLHFFVLPDHRPVFLPARVWRQKMWWVWAESLWKPRYTVHV